MKTLKFKAYVTAIEYDDGKVIASIPSIELILDEDDEPFESSDSHHTLSKPEVAVMLPAVD